MHLEKREGVQPCRILELFVYARQIQWERLSKAYFPLGEFVRANTQKSRNAPYLFAANFFASQF